MSLQPRTTDGRYAETFHAEPDFSLGAWGPAGLDLEMIGSIADDLAFARGMLVMEDSWDDGEREAKWDEYKAARARLEVYGGSDQAAIAVGSMVATRGEELAGTTVNDVRAGWAGRVEEAAAGYAAAVKAWETRPGGVWSQELYERMDEARQRMALTLDGRDEETKAGVRRLADGYQEALAEVRPMGGDLQLHAGSNRKAAELYREAAQFYPTDWLEASNSYDSPLYAEYRARRAHYADRFRLESKEPAPRQVLRTVTPGDPDPETTATPYYDWKATGKTAHGSHFDRATGEYLYGEFPTYSGTRYEVIAPGQRHRQKKDGTPWGKGWATWRDPETGESYWRRPELVDRVTDSETVSQILVGKRKTDYMAGRNPDMSTASHELAHRAEAAVAMVSDLEHDFLRRRTLVSAGPHGAMEQQALEPVHEGSSEKTRPDHFANRYMGRHYPDAYTEILSTGVESVFTGTNGALIGVGRSESDLEMRDFVLGVLATAQGAKKQESYVAPWDR